jgi:capsular polysaccharide biosynthesis protein
MAATSFAPSSPGPADVHRKWRPKEYLRFRDSLTSPVQHYWRTNDSAGLAHARTSLSRFVHEYDRTNPTMAVWIEGWLAPTRSYRLSVGSLKRANPGYSVRYESHDRHDVAAALGVSDARLGFRFGIATSGSANGPFVFGVPFRRGRLSPFDHSNPEVAVAMADDYPLSGVAGIRDAEKWGRPVHGYIDSIVERPVPTADPRSWLVALAADSPRELYELLNTKGMDESIDLVHSAIVEVSIDPEWNARFAALAGEEPPSDESGLTLVDVERPSRDVSVADHEALRMPVMVHDHSQLRAKAGTRPIPIPAQNWIRVADAQLQDGGTVLTGDRLLAYEPAADPSLDFVSGQWDSVMGSTTRPDRALLKLRESSGRTFGDAILLAGRNDDNWYHWLIEYLPRALQLEATVPDDVPFVVSERTPQSGLDALAALSSRPLLRLDSSLRHRFGSLRVLAPPVQILDTTRVPWAKGLSLNPEPLRTVRSLWVPGAEPATKRIFLRRKSARRGLVNEADLVPIAESHGLTIVDPGRMTWSEQVSLFSSAELVVGASGAVMANYLLMKPGSEILAMTSQQLSDFILPAAIASVAGVGFSYVLGQGVAKLETFDGRNSWLHSNYSLSPERFTAALRQSIDRIGHSVRP